MNKVLHPDKVVHTALQDLDDALYKFRQVARDRDLDGYYTLPNSLVGVIVEPPWEISEEDEKGNRWVSSSGSGEIHLSTMGWE